MPPATKFQPKEPPQKARNRDKAKLATKYCILPNVPLESRVLLISIHFVYLRTRDVIFFLHQFQNCLYYLCNMKGNRPKHKVLEQYEYDAGSLRKSRQILFEMVRQRRQTQVEDGLCVRLSQSHTKSHTNVNARKIPIRTVFM